MTAKIWNNAVCKETYGNAAPGGIEPHMLCAGKQGLDSCSVSSTKISFSFSGTSHDPREGFAYLKVSKF